QPALTPFPVSSRAASPPANITRLWLVLVLPPAKAPSPPTTSPSSSIHRVSSLMTSVTDCPGTCVTFLLRVEDLLPSAARSCSAGQQDRFRASGWSRRRP